MPFFELPLGGALFVSEVLYGSTALEFAAVVPCFISSITAYAVFAAIFGQGLAFRTPADLAFENFGELPIYLIFAVVCSVVGFLYVNVFYGLRNRFFKKLPISNHFKPAVGGLMLGCTRSRASAAHVGWLRLDPNGDRRALVHDLHHAPGSLLWQNPGYVLDHLFGWQWWRIRSIAVHWRHARRSFCAGVQ